jgi:hypothetical protein
MTVPAGGAANISGVIYQMLWCLLRTTRIHIADAVQNDSGDGIIAARLEMVLEPKDGGDVRVCSEIVQLKSRSGGGTWSLSETIKDVLPDLYRAVDISAPDRRYIFVTEGRMGRWGPALGFFRSLAERQPPEADFAQSLDDTAEIFRPGRSPSGAGGYWNRESYSARSLFERIVDELCEHEPAKSERAAGQLESVRKKLWFLLAGFDIQTELTPARLEAEIDSLLLAVVASDRQVKEKRLALLMGLATEAAGGDATIGCTDFLSSFGLCGLPFDASGWPRLRERSRERLRRQRRFVSFHQSEDARPDLVERVLFGWPSAAPILVISGESGQGKSWLLHALGEQLVFEAPLTLLVVATGDFDKTVGRISSDLTEEILNWDDGPSLRRLGERIRRTTPALGPIWLTLLIDVVQDPEEAGRIAKHDWQSLGIRLAVAATPQVAASIVLQAADRAAKFQLIDFSPEEVETLLSLKYDDRWIDIPTEVRSTLRRPLLASMYCAIAKDPGWIPSTEFELYDRYWDRLHQEIQIDYPSDGTKLARLASSLVTGSSGYPWTVGMLVDAELRDDAIGRLTKCGWLRRLDRGYFEVVHDRLLNWIVTKGLVESVKEQGVSPDQLAEICCSLFTQDDVRSGRSLGQVPLDVLWILTESNPAADMATAAHILESLEKSHWDIWTTVYGRLLPRVGPRLLPVLLRRLDAIAGLPDGAFGVRCVTDCVIQIRAPDTAIEARRLLADGRPQIQRAGMKILADHPDPLALDDLWVLHGQIVREPGRFEAFENEVEVFSYFDSFYALRACASLDPDWLERRVRLSDPMKEPVHDLAYLLASTKRFDIWRNNRELFFQKVSSQHERSLTSCIQAFRDCECVEWLIERAERVDDLLGLAAIRALVAIDPPRAIQAVGRLPSNVLASGRHFWLPELMTRFPLDTSRQILTLHEARSNGPSVINAFNGLEDWLPVPVLNALLDELDRLLATSTPRSEIEVTPPLLTNLRMAAKAWRYDHLRQFRLRAGTSLEIGLEAFLLRMGARPGVYDDASIRRSALTILFKIAGGSFATVVDAFLDSESQYGVFDAIEWSAKRLSRSTTERLSRIALREGLWDERKPESFPMVQFMAMKALALLGCWGELLSAVVRWGTLTQPDVKTCRFGEQPLDASVIQPAIKAFDEDRVDQAGPIMALAIAGRKDYLEHIHRAFESSPPESKTRLACIHALGLLRDDSEVALQILSAQLEHTKRGWVAEWALLNIGSDGATDVLMSRLKKQYSADTAVALLGRDRFANEVAKMISDHLTESDRVERESTISQLFETVRERERIDLVLLNSRLRSVIWEDATSFFNGVAQTPGSRILAIEAAARWSAETASAAACRIIRDPQLNDREASAFLLARIDKETARSVLFLALQNEQATTVAGAMAEALASIVPEDQLFAWFGSESSEQRYAACQIAGRYRRSESLLARLLDRLSDSDASVVTASVEALHRLEISADVEAVLRLLSEEMDVAERSILLEALIELGDPGLPECPFPDWFNRAIELMPSNLRCDYLSKRVEERREKLAREARERDRLRPRQSAR